MIHISIEGMDGVGKTTTCKLLAERLGYEFVEKPLHYLFDKDKNSFVEYHRIRDQVNSNPNRNFTSWFYGLGSLYMYETFKNKNIVTDRHLASNYAWSGSETNDDVYELLVKKIGAPKLTVILYSSTETIVNRLKFRNKDDKDIDRVKESEKIYKRMTDFCVKYDFPFIVIDSSNLTPEQVVDKIIKELN
ncbi:MAG: AAA family ATPase [Bacilli bacterium]|nr:AAA family ATPase [Bacilli bacterium]